MIGDADIRLRSLPASARIDARHAMNNAFDPAPILLASDDTALAATLDDALELGSISTIENRQPAVIQREIEHLHPRALLLDSRFLAETAPHLCHRLRRDGATATLPIIVITSPDDIDMRVKALENGADDCISVPGDLRELTARIQAKLWRSSEPFAGRLRAGPIEIDLDRWSASLSGTPISLTKKEFQLLQALIESRGRTLTREYLLHKVWALSANVETRTIDVHIARLRQKLGAVGRLILTVRNVGFRLDIMPDWITGRPSPSSN